jgi:hypothetical protein
MKSTSWPGNPRCPSLGDRRDATQYNEQVRVRLFAFEGGAVWPVFSTYGAQTELVEPSGHSTSTHTEGPSLWNSSPSLT